jgi:hypothetical protein
MPWVFLVTAVVVMVGVAIYGLHRLASWAEARGWIFYKEKGRTGVASNALLELDAIWKPEMHQVVEEREIEADHEVDDESGDRRFDLTTEGSTPSKEPDHR